MKKALYNNFFFLAKGSILLLILTIQCQFNKEEASSFSLLSPGESVVVRFELDQGIPKYEVDLDGKPIILSSGLGLDLANAPDLLNAFEIIEVEQNTKDESWSTVWGQESEIRNHYNELTVHLKEKEAPARLMDIIFRAYDDGVGFRYHIPEQEGLHEIQILSEETQFQLAGDFGVWYQASDTVVEDWEHGFDTYERLYEKRSVSEVDQLMHTPATFVGPDNIHFAIHEANLTDYASMTLSTNPQNQLLESFLVPWPDGIKVKSKAPLYSPWRTIQWGKDAAALADSRLILNLNEPLALEDVSWIKPMKYAGVWWEMHMDKSTWDYGPRHGATTENTQRYIDFAAAYGLGGVLVEGWNKGWEDWINNPGFSFTESYPDYDLAHLAKLAKTRSVELIGHHETSGDIPTYEAQMEDAFRLLQEHDINAVKTGYVGPIRVEEKGHHHQGQMMVNHYRKVLETAARHKVSVVAHEPIKPTGLSRTYPNMLSQEAMRGMEYNAWSDGNPASHTTILPFTMGLAGPLDYTPGIFKVNFEPYRQGNSTHTTLANQLALYVVIHSPVQMVPDFPEHYESHPAFQFIRDVPTTWSESHVLAAEIGSYVMTARKCRASDDWYIGAITNEESRELSLTLDFIDEEQVYKAEIYADGPDASFLENADQIIVETQEIKYGQTLNLRLAAGGGQAIRISPLSNLESENIARSALTGAAASKL